MAFSCHHHHQYKQQQRAEQGAGQVWERDCPSEVGCYQQGAACLQFRSALATDGDFKASHNASCDPKAVVQLIQYVLANIGNPSVMLRCHIYDNQSIIHLLGLPLPCVDPTAMLPAHIWLHGAPLSPGWDLPLVMGHLGGQMKLRLDECFVYYEYGTLWRH
ncbi:hypothetical protein Q8A73_017500 [Channa argus]|nr:hypothetical protein Q8A73_017500 [Channa argus]